MTESEFWQRMTQHLGDTYARVWAVQVVVPGLDGATASEALAAGVPCRTIWRAVWTMLELPDRER
ncbi:MAG TPA: DUF3046 domain-containing protein [Propionibacteriaceae bacterium]|nr:DUF3046 domain-containing protein [Propionibacteriaceae bacterium]